MRGAAAPPAPLACLARWYPVKAVLENGAWFAALPDGQRVPWEDGRSKTFEEKLEEPDVEDAFSLRYATGAISPVTSPDHDPGRVRLDPVFRAAYGSSEKEVEGSLVKLVIAGQELRVHRRAAPAFVRVAKRLESLPEAARPFLSKLAGTFVWRNIAGTDRPSAHSYGVSIDLNVDLSDYWQWKAAPRGTPLASLVVERLPQPVEWANRVPQEIVDAFEAEGFLWGGRWYHYDTMHFEWRPELLDPTCYEVAKIRE